jgi:hypothetical protein
VRILHAPRDSGPGTYALGHVGEMDLCGHCAGLLAAWIAGARARPGQAS